MIPSPRKTYLNPNFFKNQPHLLFWFNRIFPIEKNRYLDYLKSIPFRICWTIKCGLINYPLQFVPFSSQKSTTPTCVVGNAVPKCGTYLLDAIIKSLGAWEQLQIHVNARHWNTLADHPTLRKSYYSFPHHALRKLRNGQFIAAHLPYERAIEKVIDQKNHNRRIKHIFMYRDPRDSWVSYMRYFTYSDNERGCHQKFLQESFNNDSERLEYIIRQDYGYYTLRYLPWLESSNTHVIRFEELYPDILKLKEGVWGETIKGLLNYLEVDTQSINPKDFHKMTFNEGPTASAEFNKVGQYKKYFEEKHYALVSKPERAKIIKAFGYEL